MATTNTILGSRCRLTSSLPPVRCVRLCPVVASPRMPSLGRPLGCGATIRRWRRTWRYSSTSTVRLCFASSRRKVSRVRGESMSFLVWRHPIPSVTCTQTVSGRSAMLSKSGSVRVWVVELCPRPRRRHRCHRRHRRPQFHQPFRVSVVLHSRQRQQRRQHQRQSLLSRACGLAGRLRWRRLVGVPCVSCQAMRIRVVTRAL